MNDRWGGSRVGGSVLRVACTRMERTPIDRLGAAERIVLAADACLRLMGEPGISPRGKRLMARVMVGLTDAGFIERVARAYRMGSLEQRRAEVAQALEEVGGC